MSNYNRQRTYIVSETAPLAGSITNGLQARRHIEAFDQYAQRIPAGSVGLPFHLTLEKADLARLLQSAVQRIYGEDVDLDDAVFGGQATLTRKERLDEDDEVFSGSAEFLSTPIEEKDRLSISAVEKLRLERLKAVK